MGRLIEPVNSKQTATFVVLVLMSMVLSFIEVPMFGDLGWLKYDPSGVVVALVALLYGPWQGIAVAVLSWLPHAAIGPLGAGMNIMASAALALVLGSVYRKRRNLACLAAGGVLGAVAATAVSICLNFVATPLYLSATYEEVAALVLPYLLPFNLIKALVNVALAAAALHLLRGVLDEGGNGLSPANVEAGSD